MTKWIVFILIVFLSCFYIWGIWPKHKPTNYITQAILRLFFFGLSVVYLAVSPLMLLLMTPEYSFSDFYILPLKIYSIFISILGILILIDMLRLGMFYILSKAGLDVTNERISDIITNIENNKHFLKMKKKGGFNIGRRRQ